ncbi:hypothetical protein Trydic_g3020 [Trypoxylus dichotomus]
MKTILKVALGTTFTLVAGGLLIFGIVSLTTGTESDRCEYASVPLSIYVERNDSNLVISWYEPWPNPECQATYSLQYWINDGQRTEVNTTSNRHTIYFLSLEPCSMLYLQLAAISVVGNVNPGYITRNYTEIPANAHVTDIQYINANESLLVTWKKPIELTTCDVHYQVEYGSEFGRFIIESNSENATIPHHDYCFELFPFYINSWVGDYLSSYTIHSYRDNKIVTQVNVSVLPENQEELVVTWNRHFKHELCMLEYQIKYSSNSDIEEQSLSVIEPEARFRFKYCVEAVVIISSFAFERNYTGPIDIFDATAYSEDC